MYVLEVCDYDDLLTFRSKFRLKKADTDFKKSRANGKSHRNINSTTDACIYI